LLLLLLPQENGDESGGADSTNQGSFQYLLALHALTAADPSLAVPSADTQRYVRLLAPYASNLGGIGAPAQGGRMSAGMLCVLYEPVGWGILLRHRESVHVALGGVTASHGMAVDTLFAPPA
jgi:hypothetical protein